MGCWDGRQCVACGHEIGRNHHCSPQYEARVAANNRRAEQDYLNRKPTRSMRFHYGFYLLSVRGDFGDALPKRPRG